MTASVYDVVIVGTGPAGAIAGYTLASAGFSVLLLEKAHLPRYKPCGGGVTTKALRLLDFDVSAIVEREINDARVAFAASPFIDVAGRGIGKMFMRPAFDGAIVERAAAAGAVVRDGCKVESIARDGVHARIHSTRGDFIGRFVVGADGTESVVAQSIGADPLECGVAIEAEVEVTPGAVDQQRVLFDFGALEHGYGYVFPKASHLSVGLYSTLPAVARLRERLDRYLASDRLPPVCRVRSCVGHRVPLGRLRTRLHADDAVLVGDAAGIADPVWGEGIYYALRSGLIAAEVIAGGLKTGQPALSRYPEILRAELGGRLTWARRVAALVYRLPERSLATLVADDELAGLMMGVLRGDVEYGQYLRAVMRSLPKLAMQTRWRSRSSTERLPLRS